MGGLGQPYLRELGMSTVFIGRHFVAAGVQAAASFGGGFLADAFGRRRIWLAGKGMHIAAFAVLACGVTGPALFAAPVLSGLSQIGVGVYSATTADATDGSGRATFFAILRTVDSTVAVLAPLAGGLIADCWGVRTAFVLAIPMLIGVALIIRRLHEPPRCPGGLSASRSPAAKGLASGLAARLVDGVVHGPYPRTAYVMTGFQLLNGLGNGLIGLAIPLILKDVFGMGYTGINAAQTTAALGSALTMVVGGRIADRRGRRTMMLASSLAGTAAFAFMPVVNAGWQFYVLLFALCLLDNAAAGAFSATTMECVKPAVRATFGGITQGIWSGGYALGNLAGGLLYTAGADAPAIAVIAVNALTTALLWAFVEETGRTRRPRGPTAEEGTGG